MPDIPRLRHRFFAPLLFGFGALACPLAHAQASAEPLAPVPTTWRLSHETWQLPGTETMGMVGGNVMFSVTESLKLGVGSYGAVSGNRGGFITLGVNGEWEQRLGRHWSAQAGVFVGGGGGRGGLGLAGGGLMLRGHAGLSYDLGPHGRIGVGVSRVHFPSGTISSTQPYLQYDYRFDSVLRSGWSAGPAGSHAGDRPSWTRVPQEFAVVARSYRIPAGVRRADGLPQHPSLNLIGVEWSAYLDPNWFLKLESEGAMGGESSGYMQILLGGGYRLPVGAGGSALKLHAALGPAGGGAVDTGGGLLLDAGVAWQQRLSASRSLEVGLSRVYSPGNSFKANSLSVKLVHHFDRPQPERGAVLDVSGLAHQPLRVRLANQTYFKGAANWRCCFPDTAVNNVALQLDHLLSPPEAPTRWFVTGQGVAAHSGGAGAYMAGLLGLGVQRPLGGPWFVEGEALLGAAGGGGLAINGGLVHQFNAGIGYRLTPALSVLASVGRIGAVRGPFRAHTLGVALAYDFTGFGVAPR